MCEFGTLGSCFTCTKDFSRKVDQNKDGSSVFAHISDLKIAQRSLCNEINMRIFQRQSQGDTFTIAHLIKGFV